MFVAPAGAAITYVGRVAGFTTAVSATSVTMTAGRAIASGDAIMVAVLLSSTSTAAVRITDSAGNSYALDRDLNDAAGGDRVLVFSATNARPLPSGGVLTATFPKSAGCQVSVDEFSGVAALERAASASATGASFSSGPSGTISQPGELVLGVVGEESGVVPKFATGWTALPTLSVSTDRLTVAYQVAPSLASFTAGGTISGTWMAAVLAYPASAPAIDAPPVAHVTVVNVAPPSFDVQADGTTSTDLDATPIASYRFDFGDGTAPVTTLNGKAAHSYSSAGTYTITLIATDSGGLASLPAAASVTVAPPPPPLDLAPVARITIGNAAPSLAVTADGSTSTDTDATPIASYQFDFGDGTPPVTVSAPATAASHTYAAPGTYTVALTARDTHNLTSASVSSAVSVAAPPIAGAPPRYVARIASSTLATTSTSVTLSATRAVPGGDALLVALLLSSCKAGAVTVTDVAGNAYSLDREQTDGAANDRTLLFSARNMKPLAQGQTLKITYPSAAACHAAVEDFAGITAFDKAASAFATGTAFNSGSTTTTAQPSELVFGVVGIESGVAPAWTASATALTALSIGSDRLGDAYRTTTAAGTFAATGTTSGTWMAICATYTGAAPPATPPVARLAVSATTTPALTVVADGSASTDPNATPIASYQFDFGDGTPPVITLNGTASHSYGGPGTYTITLVATGAGQLASSPAVTSITLAPPPPPDLAPVARLTVSNAAPSLDVQADGSASTDTDTFPIASYRFNFGDGTAPVTVAAPATTASHSYATPGTYTVTLIATDTGALASTPATASVTVAAPPPPDLAPVARLAVTNAAQSLDVQADGAASTDSDITPIATYQFDFGDGTPPVITTAPVTGSAHTYGSAGSYTITLIVTDSGNSASVPATRSVTVSTPPPELPPDARLSVANVSPPSLDVITDGSASTDIDSTPIATYTFDFGDGTPPVTTTAPTATASHSYAIGGTYTVSLIATDTDDSASAPVSANVTVVPDSAPVASVVVTNPDAPSLGVVADGSGSTDTDGSPIKSYEFNFGDGTATVTILAPASSSPHAYAAPGTYHVTLVATDTHNLASAPASDSVTVAAAPDSAPVASVTVANIAPPSLAIQADGAGSTDADASPIASYRFDFGDSTAPVTVAAPVTKASHTYAAPGTYTVTLIATDTGALASTPATASITVAAPPPPDFAPVARLTVSNAAPSLTVQADGTGSTDADVSPVASYRFDFGDGTPPVTVAAPVTKASHTYAAPGTYTVTLIATDTGALASTPATASITVAAPPPPDFAPVARLVMANAAPSLAVQADGTGSTDTDVSPVASYRFDFGDGTAPVTVAAPATKASHTYAAPGTYTVTLIATDTGALASTPASASVTVAAPPPPDFAPVARLVMTNAAPSLTVQADATSSTDLDGTPIASYRFDFGDGTAPVNVAAPATTASHGYASPGTYAVTLVATDTGALASSPATASVTVTTAPPRYVARIASTTFATTSTTISLAPDRDVAGGDALLVALLLSSCKAGAVTVTDAAGNAYSLDREQTNGAAGDRTLLFSARNAKPLAQGQVLKITYPSAAACHVAVEEFSGITAFDKAASAFATGTAFSSGLTAPTAQPSELVFGVVGIESGVAPAWAAPATALPTLSIGSDLLGDDYRMATATGAFASAGTAAGSWMSICATYTAGPPPEAPPVAALFVTPRPNPSLAVIADGSPSTDQDATPIASWRFDFGDGTAPVTVTSQDATASHTYAVKGTYTVTLIATDTGGSASAPAHATVTVPAPAPVDDPPIARLSVSQASTPALTVIADASGSTDLDATPIASYKFDFGDGTPVVSRTAPVSTANHTYAATGTFVIKLTATDAGGKVSAVVSASVTQSSTTSSSGPVAVYVGYYDTHHPGNTQTKPNPWMSSSNVVFVGVPDPGTVNSWDSAALRVDNLTGAAAAVTVTANIGSKVYDLWGSQTVPAGGRLVLAQTSFEAFDGSDTNPAGCYGCDPADCARLISNTIPVVHVTVAGKTTDYYDSGQVLNTKGADGAGCPYTGTRNDESHAWQQVLPKPALLAQPAHAGAAVADSPLQGVWLAPAAPNPTLGDLDIRFRTPAAGPVRIGVFDVTGRMVRTCADGVFEPGTHLLHVNLAGAPAGVYYCTLWTTSGTRRTAFVLMR